MVTTVVKNQSSLALVEEVTEGTYVAPSSGADYVELLEDGTEFQKSRPEIERNLLSSSIERDASRVGTPDVTGSIPVEWKASLTAGEAPQSMDLLLKSLLGGKRQLAAQVTSKAASHSSTEIEIEDADIGDFAVGDIVVVLEAGAHEARPISAIDDGAGVASITFPFALDNGAPSSAVVLEKYTTYYSDSDNVSSLSAEYNEGNVHQNQVTGLKAASASFENWTPSTLPSVNFSMNGLGFTKSVASQSFTPSFSDALPPVINQACVWINGVKYEYPELSMSIENTLVAPPTACDPDGKLSNRLTDQVTTLNISPYVDATNIDLFNLFENNDDVSVFGYAFNPDSVSGEIKEVIAFWLPQAKVVEAPSADQDGVVTRAMSIKAHKSSGNDSVFLGFV